jgi:penicillin amidase
MKIVLRTLPAAMLATLGLALVPSSPAEARQAMAMETHRVAGLAKPAEILVDQWGVPHIYARSRDDAIYAQGFNAARDRLFQVDLWRRRGLGQLAEVLGPAYVAQDEATRLFLYRGDMQREWKSYGTDAERMARSFTAGINAYVDFLQAHPERMPFEFRTLGYAPAKWQPEDVVRIRSHGLTRNLNSEVARAAVACKADLKSDEVRFGLTPPWQAVMPEGLDPCLPKDLLAVFRLATQNVRITKEAVRAAAGGADIRVAFDENPDSTEGSNNWVVAPSKSATGRAIMANDPHRAYSAPSLRYIVHLNAPGMNVIGAGEPALPGISIGHNGTIAFGLTIFNIDQEDLYVYELNPERPDEYRYRGQWEPFRVVQEQVAVRGGPPVTVDLRFTRHGPVVFVEKDKNRAFAVRSGWLEPGMAPYFGSVGYMQARSFREFKNAMLNWGAPTENQVYADVQGNIGWVPGGLAPKRPNWDGLLPVPGDGRYEWDGFWSGAELPYSYNPAKGWFSSSNEMNLPPEYPYQERKLGFEWTNGSRHARIEEVLAATPKVSIEDSMRLQNDDLAIPARRLVALVQPLPAADPKAHAAQQVFTGWDYVERSDSAPAALYEVWLSRHLGNAFKKAVLTPEAAAAMGAPDVAVMLDALEKPQALFGADASARRNAVLLESLAGAYAEMEKLQGPDNSQWQWGRLHHTLMEHPLAAAMDDAGRARLNVGPLPKRGGAYTPNQSTYRASDFRQTNGPSFRLVVDVGNWDNSRAVNAPGQSGDPESPHYRDLAGMWLKGDYFPLLYSRGKVLEATRQRIRLQPAK